jgi:hypothetical protein
MKRSLRRGDMRDMSLGQLQVITNDLYSQIQSEYTHVRMHTHHRRLVRGGRLIIMSGME